MTVAPKALTLFDSSTIGCAPAADGKAEVAGQVLCQVTQAVKLVGKAQECLARAIADARSAGYSWRRIGTAAAVPYQSLHRRFAYLADETLGGPAT